MKTRNFVVPKFRPRLPWLGGDLQSIRNTVVQPVVSFDGYRRSDVRIDLPDGTGDVLLGTRHDPVDSGDDSRPLVILIHGLTGSADSIYMRVSALQLLRRGFPVVRLNMRGAGRSRPLCRETYNAGCSDDLWAAVSHLAPGTPGDGVFVVGFSLGGGVVTRMLAERAPDPALRGGAVVSTPINLHAAAERIRQPRNFLYQRRLLNAMKEETLAAPVTLAPEDRRKIRDARTVYEMDRDFVAPHAGYESVDAYYDRNSASKFLPIVALPLLVIYALNDPWIPSGDYRRFDWSANPMLIPAITRGGGHVGFHDRQGTWHNRCIGDYFEWILRRR